MEMIDALFATAFGGALALAGVFLTNRANAAQLKAQLEHNDAQTRAEMIRARGEELYELTDEWLTGLHGHYITRKFVMLGKITYNQGLDVDIGATTKGNFGRIQMLIDVYFPNIKSSYEAVISARSEINAIEAQHKERYESGIVDGQPFVEPYARAQSIVQAKGKELQSQIIESIRKA